MKWNLKRMWAAASLAVCTVATVGSAGEVTLPHAFTPGTPAKASEVNANFSALKTAIAEQANAFIANQTSAAQAAGFNIAGTASITGVAPRSGKGTVGYTKGATTLLGTGTAFGTDVAPGDLVTVLDAAGKPLRSQHVLSIANPTTLTLDAAAGGDASNLAFLVQKPIAQFNVAAPAGAPPALVVKENGNVGIGSLNPTSALDVTGIIKGGGVLAGAFYAAPTSPVAVAGTGAGYNPWSDVSPDSALDVVLERPAKLFITYAINVQPSAAPGADHLLVRMTVDGTPYKSSASHFQPYCQGDCNVTLTGNLVLALAPGSHRIALQWSVYGNKVTWSNDPTNWCEGYCGARTLTALAFYE